jgi:hypothetical protein
VRKELEQGLLRRVKGTTNENPSPAEEEPIPPAKKRAEGQSATLPRPTPAPSSPGGNKRIQETNLSNEKEKEDFRLSEF